MNGRFNYMEQIISKVLADTTVPVHSIHGKKHWDTVARFGERIATGEGLDFRFIKLFSLFHDCQRLNDGHDPEHGPRGAKYLKGYSPDELEITRDEHERLMFACRYHTYEQPTEDKLIHACWDADRLDLPRVGIVIDPERLFTGTAKSIAKEINYGV